MVLSFDGERACSDGGLPVLSAAGKRMGMWDVLKRRLPETRTDRRVRHEPSRMAMQRILGICCGYEDCNDFDTLRDDPLFDLSTLHQGVLASQPTLSRFENAVSDEAIKALTRDLVDLVLSQTERARSVVIDLDATDDPAHGQQEFAFYNTHAGGNCYMAQLATIRVDGSRPELVWADLRPGNHGASRDSARLVAFLVFRVRARFPGARILVRADGAYSVPKLLNMCEYLRVKYVIGFCYDASAKEQAEPFLKRAKEAYDGTPQTVYGEFKRKTKSWKSERRIVCKASFDGEAKVRLVVTNLTGTPEKVYRRYCDRGEMENRIKDMKRDLSSGRTSCHGYRANRLRLVLHAYAVALMASLRKCMRGTELEHACPATLRLKLLKVAAFVQTTTRRVLIRFTRHHPWLDYIRHAVLQLA